MNYLTIERVTKHFGEKKLFEDITLHINQGDKIGLIAKNGTGKTTLLKVIAGLEDVEGEHRKIEIHPDIKIGYLPQQPNVDLEETVFGEIFRSENPKIQAVKNYQRALISNLSPAEMESVIQDMERHAAWDMEAKIKELLEKLKVNIEDRKLKDLSGGQRKRVALVKILLEQPDFLILDEPTNHLDLDMIEWLEGFLNQPQITLFLITHDRYFLENVCDHIVELEGGKLYKYSGNYSEYLEKKEERIHNQQTQFDKTKKLFKKELEWMRRQPKARGTKAKSRIDAFQEIKKEVKNYTEDASLKFHVKPEWLGSKILEFHNVSFGYESAHILEGFDYKFKRKERVGIIGPNGSGKSTFTRLMVGEIQPQTGKIVVGETVNFGDYKQEGIALREDKRVIDVVRDVAEGIPLEKGKFLTAEQLLERFLFPRPQQQVYVSKLSGGEKRRLYLLTILMQNPNFLILDEPTNDLDIVTLNVLETYLMDFPGCLVVISHDRFFMDKIVDHLFVLEGNGKVKDFPGSYTQYRNWSKSQEQKTQIEKNENKQLTKRQDKAEKKEGLSYEERKKLRNIENKIERLGKEKSKLSERFNDTSLSGDKIQELSKSIADINEEIDTLEMEWMELAEKA